MLQGKGETSFFGVINGFATPLCELDGGANASAELVAGAAQLR